MEEQKGDTGKKAVGSLFQDDILSAREMHKIPTLYISSLCLDVQPEIIMSFALIKKLNLAH